VDGTIESNSKPQAPSSKLQAPEKLQISSSKTSISRRPTPARVVERASHVDFGLWSLGFFWSLELGALPIHWARARVHGQQKAETSCFGFALSHALLLAVRYLPANNDAHRSVPSHEEGSTRTDADNIGAGNSTPEAARSPRPAPGSRPAGLPRLLQAGGQ
jgi:hypothetical protein